MIIRLDIKRPFFSIVAKKIANENKTSEDFSLAAQGFAYLSEQDKVSVLSRLNQILDKNKPLAEALCEGLLDRNGLLPHEVLEKLTEKFEEITKIDIGFATKLGEKIFSLRWENDDPRSAAKIMSAVIKYNKSSAVDIIKKFAKASPRNTITALPEVILYFSELQDDIFEML